MGTDASKTSRADQPEWVVLTPVVIQQIDEKLAEAIKIGYATIELIVQKGKLRWIRGPAPSEPARMQ